jgi:uncharacterized protein (TIGR03382 family)
MIRWLALSIPLASAAISALASAPAHAQAFPGDAAYVPLRCAGNPMTDAPGDVPSSPADRDLVGATAAPAGLRAGDAQFLYLRIRVNQDPAPPPAGTLHPYAWGMAFDLDGDRRTYELLITVDGIATPAGTVSVFTNRVSTRINDPADPADTPAAASFAFATAARTVGAGTLTSGDPDFFVDIAVPWATLAPLGLKRETRTYVWAGSSSVASALDGDLACHDGGGGGGGAPGLDATGSDPTTGDPAQDTGDGSLRLEGGSGCQAGGSLGIGAALALLGLSGRLRRRGSGSLTAGGRRCTAPDR